jgi:hypothetical protein
LPYAIGFNIYSFSTYVGNALDSGSLFTVWYVNISQFGFTQAGAILAFAVEAFRDVGLVIVEIALNIVSVNCLRSYMAKRKKLLNGSPIEATATTKSGSRKQETARVVSAVAPVINQVVVQKQSPPRGSPNAGNNVSSAELRVTVMALIMCLLSILEHFMMIGCVVYPYSYAATQFIAANMCLGFNFSASFKNTVNFFIFLSFNKKFGQKLRKLFKIQQS